MAGGDMGGDAGAAGAPGSPGARLDQLPAEGEDRARSHCRVASPSTHYIPDSLSYSAPLSLTRQCDRTPGEEWKLEEGDN